MLYSHLLLSVSYQKLHAAYLFIFIFVLIDFIYKDNRIPLENSYAVFMSCFTERESVCIHWMWLQNLNVGRGDWAVNTPNLHVVAQTGMYNMNNNHMRE